MAIVGLCNFCCTTIWIGLTRPSEPAHTTCQIGLLLIDCHLVTSGIACKSLNFKTKTVERLNLDGQTMYLPLGLPCYVYLCGFYAFTFTFLSQSIKPSNFFSAYSRSLLSAPQTHQSVRAKQKSTLTLR